MSSNTFKIVAFLCLFTFTGCQEESKPDFQISLGRITASSAVIKWTDVFTLSNISFYEIHLQDSLIEQVQNASFYEITNLAADSDFYGQIIAINSETSQQQAASFSFSTIKNSAPDQFSALISHVTGTSMYVSWDKPYDADSDEITFDVLINNSPIVENIIEQHYTFTDLTPSTNYSLTIVARDGHGNSSEWSLSFNTMGEGAEIAYNQEKFQGSDREYGIFIPATNNSELLPLVINIHGWSGIVWPDMMNDYFVELAEKEDFIFMAPQGRIGTDGYSYWDHQIDTDFLDQLIDSTRARYPVDTERIYVLGHSNGAFMTLLLAEAIEDELAAIGAVAGTFFQPYTLNKPMPLCYIHGTEDATVQYDGGQHVSVDQLTTFFISNNQLNPTPTVEELPNSARQDNSTVTKFTYLTNNGGSSDLVHYRINGGNHQIPGISIYTNNFDINSYDKFWAFFKSRKLSDK